MDPTQAHSAGPSLTVRLDSRTVDSVLQEIAEATLVELLGSPLTIERSAGQLRVEGPGSSGAVSLTVLPRSGGVSSVRLEGGIEGWESLVPRLRDRFLRSVARHCGPVPADGFCHALGFGRECDRRMGHTGNHLSVRGIPAAWTADGAELVSFESRFVVEDLLDRIHTLESMVERARSTAMSSARPGPPGARHPNVAPRVRSEPLSIPSRAKPAPRHPPRSGPGHRRRTGSRSSR